MANRKARSSDNSTELIRTLLIVQLGLAEVPQKNIREIAGGDMNKINKIIKNLNINKKRGKSNAKKKNK